MNVDLMSSNRIEFAMVGDIQMVDLRDDQDQCCKAGL